MAETQASIGYGSLFEISTNGGDTYTTIAEVYDVTPPSFSVDEVDATHMQSPNRTREFIAGLTDPGECSFEMNFVPGSDSDLLIQSVQASGDAVTCRITYPNGVTWTFTGILRTYEPAAPTEDRMTATVTFRVSSSFVATPSAAPTNVVLPAISGTAQVGQTLYAFQGTWTGGASYSFQWQEDDGGWDDIGGATSQTYDPVAGNVGNPLRVVVTATNGAGSTSATSAPTANVLAE